MGRPPGAKDKVKRRKPIVKPNPEVEQEKQTQTARHLFKNLRARRGAANYEPSTTPSDQEEVDKVLPLGDDDKGKEKTDGEKPEEKEGEYEKEKTKSKFQYRYDPHKLTKNLRRGCRGLLDTIFPSQKKMNDEDSECLADVTVPIIEKYSQQEAELWEWTPETIFLFTVGGIVLSRFADKKDEPARPTPEAKPEAPRAADPPQDKNLYFRAE